MSVITEQVALRLTDVSKAFGGVRALKGVSLEVRAGEVHALLGENGAGKSTLMAVAAGAVQPDGGAVEIGGNRLTHTSPTEALALGLAVVYQHPAIADDLTVMENLLLAVPPEKRPSYRDAPAWTWDRLDAVGVQINPLRRVASLTAAEHQLVEIAKALAIDPRVLVLDEPTAALGAAEVEHLFQQIRAIRERGTAVVYISHRLPEITEIADRFTVLRDGESKGTFPASDFNPDEILALIVGRQIDAVFPGKLEGEPGQDVLTVHGFAGHSFDEFDLTIRAGEVVGLAGVAGNGQQELIRALAGLEPSTGEVRVHGVPVRLAGPVSARRSGIAYVPADRQREGLFGSLSLRENAAAVSLGAYASAGFVRGGLERAAVSRQSAALAVRAASPEIGVETLSGGNQQKVVFARALLSAPEVLLCDEPTQGVDVGARVEIYAIIRDLARAGKAVLICSSDALELEGLCDRVIVVSRGTAVAELTGEAISEQAITGAAVNAVTSRQGRAGSTTDPGRRERGSWSRTARLLHGDNVATPVVAAMIALLAAFTGLQHGAFFGAFNIDNLLLLSTALIFASVGQLVVLLTGGVDLSVGPMMGLGVVLFTHVAGGKAGTGSLVLGVLELMACGAALGLINGLMVRLVGMPPVIATLSTYIALQGVGLIINPVPDSTLSTSVSADLSGSIGGLIPWTFVVAVAVALVAELTLRRRRIGMAVRAVGSSEPAAHRLGIGVSLTTIGAYVVCAMFAGLAAVMLAVQIGTGDATSGQQYTLESIAAVVVGGASIFGGRGTFIGATLGALLLTEVINVLPFLQLGNAWQFWIPGAVVLGAAAVYARVTRFGGQAPAAR